MNTITHHKTPEQMVEAIFALDLDPIKLKLMDKEEGQGWSRAEADHYELEYKRFLALLARFPDEVIAPGSNVDKVWHAHILDTLKYGEDCENIFGYFLHHFPYFGMRGEEDAANLRRAADNMKQLYEREFGTAAQSAGSAFCGAAKPGASAYCGAAKEAQSAHCGAAKGADKTAYCGVAAGLGRPKLEPAEALA